MHGACGVRRGHVGIPTHSRDSSGFVNKNGAVLEGRRRDGMDPASSDAQHALRVHTLKGVLGKRCP